MKSKRKSGSKTGSIVALCVVLVLTVLAGLLGANGLGLPPRGLYKILPWLPSTDAEAWPEAIQLGLDLRGGMYVEYTAEAPEGTTQDMGELINGTIQIIRQRLTDKGYTEANIQKIEPAGIRVEIPASEKLTNDEIGNALDLIGAEAKLEFLDPSGNVFMDGSMVDTARYVYDQGDHQVAFTLKPEGAEIFREMTSNNIGKQLTIMLDGEKLIAPTVNDPITNGSGVINRMGSAEYASTVAAKIQSGALPLKLTQDHYGRVSATLGRDALSTSVRAAIIGILLVMCLMIVRYRLNGVIASWALTIYVILLFFFLAVFSIQLTLPGLAGVVLGIGMAVDANVIIFERFNEETRKGRSAKAAVRSGFKNAMSAILDSNVTTLIAAIVLLIFGTGSIQGFARTLLLGVVTSMITAILVTRFLMNRFVNAGVTKVSLYTRIKDEKEVDAQ